MPDRPKIYNTLTVHGVPRRYPDIVQNLAVLAAIFPKYRRNRIGWMAARVRHLWQRRVKQLKALKYGPFVTPVATANRYRTALRCYPTFVITREQPRTCNTNTLCPFCWARQVRATWIEVDRAFFRIEPVTVTLQPPPHNQQRVRVIDLGAGSQAAPPPPVAPPVDRQRVSPDYDLVTRTLHATVAPAQGELFEDQPLRKFFRQRAQVRAAEHKRVLNGAKTWGALETVYVMPDMAKQQWKVEVRQLFLVPRGHVTRRRGPGAQARVTARPGRADVLRAVARTLRYPAFLLDPTVDPAGARIYAETREGVRLTATSGVFRKEKTS